MFLIANSWKANVFQTSDPEMAGQKICSLIKYWKWMKLVPGKMRRTNQRAEHSNLFGNHMHKTNLQYYISNKWCNDVILFAGWWSSEFWLPTKPAIDSKVMFEAIDQTIFDPAKLSAYKAGLNWGKRVLLSGFISRQRVSRRKRYHIHMG